MKSFTLHTGAKIPAVGYGTWEISGDQIGTLLPHAIDVVGYRHIDCAHVYGNEKEIGKVLKNTKVPRSELFITSKLWNTHHRPELVEKALQTTLDNLQLEYLDLYLMHWPCGFVPGDEVFPKDANGKAKIDDVDFVDTWKAMEKLVETGKVKHIGVSNFTIKKLEKVLSICKIKPAANQVEMHPYLVQKELYDFCNSKGIHVTAYSPLGGSGDQLKLLNDPKLQDIGKKHNATSAKICISWAAQRTSVIPKSTKKDRIKDNFDIVDLKEDEINEINKLDKNARSVKMAVLPFDIFQD